MTIREFQKTAGLEIKKKLTETPSAKAFKEGTKKYPKIKEHGAIIILRRFIEDRQLRMLAPLYQYKTGRLIKKKMYQVKHMLNYYQHIMYYESKHYSEIKPDGNGFQDREKLYKISRKLRRIGWIRFWEHNFVRAYSREYHADAILNFDNWHTKLGNYKQIPKFEGM